jgi:DNA-binding CsgD family transcriptional regulator
MPWLDAWKAIRPNNVSPYVFVGQWMGEAMTASMVRLRWRDLRLMLGIHGLWNYNLRRTLASCLSNELQIDDVTIRAILNHADGSALGHYCFKSFDSLTKPIQRYADWLCALQDSTGMSREPASLRAVPKEHQTPPRHALAYIPPPVSAPARQSAMRPLSGRERQILALIVDGRSYQEIADTLTLSIPTVGCYRGRLLDRLQLTTTGELIAYAREHALTTMPMLVIKRGRVGADRQQVTRS